MNFHRKDVRIAARLSEEQKTLLDAYCKQNRLSIGEVIRNLVETLEIEDNSGEVTSLASDIPIPPKGPTKVIS
jgi:hypothetical protein